MIDPAITTIVIANRRAGEMGQSVSTALRYGRLIIAARTRLGTLVKSRHKKKADIAARLLLDVVTV
jgi:hypothetical protein